MAYVVQSEEINSEDLRVMRVTKHATDVSIGRVIGKSVSEQRLPIQRFFLEVHRAIHVTLELGRIDVFRLNDVGRELREEIGRVGQIGKERIESLADLSVEELRDHETIHGFGGIGPPPSEQPHSHAEAR